jgi:hypothetical protein
MSLSERRWRWSGLLVLSAVLLLLTLLVSRPQLLPAVSAAESSADGAVAEGPAETFLNFLPLTVNDPLNELVAPLCRFGLNVIGGVNNSDTGVLRLGWYLNYSYSVAPPRPNGIEYMPIIGLRQYPSINTTQILQAVAANPGSSWFIGNEPDRRHVQDGLHPHVYAQAYHELYYLIKGEDPTARIVAGNIVQPTPVRLLYLDMVLNSYVEQYGEPMPVDVWGIHAFILRERSCLHFPQDCTGAEIPPGIDWAEGEVPLFADHDNVELFTEGIVRFRQWMHSRGYGDLPLYLSEYGILMPDWLADENGNQFPPARVNAFMSQTFDYLRTATNLQLGNPYDSFRLVQRFAWYSDVDDYFNGNLFDPATFQPTAMGNNFAAYTGALSETVDLYPARIFADPLPFSQGENVTFTLKAEIANSGNRLHASQPVVARFYNGDPAAGGMQIGTTEILAGLSGCGAVNTAQVTWANVPPASYQVFVTVDPVPYETNDANNRASQTIFVATERAFLPTIMRSGPLSP